MWWTLGCVLISPKQSLYSFKKFHFWKLEMDSIFLIRFNCLLDFSPMMRREFVSATINNKGTYSGITLTLAPELILEQISISLVSSVPDYSVFVYSTIVLICWLFFLTSSKISKMASMKKLFFIYFFCCSW